MVTSSSPRPDKKDELEELRAHVKSVKDDWILARQMRAREGAGELADMECTIELRRINWFLSEIDALQKNRNEKK